jgi:hypothetical protein
VTTDPLDDIALRIAEQPQPDPETVDLIRQRLLAAAADEDAWDHETVVPKARWRRSGLWTHRVIVVAVAAAILVVFFVPLPHLNLFKRLVNPSKPSPIAVSNRKPVGTQLAVMKASDGVAGSCFGAAVAVSGDKAVVGAPCHGPYGRAYVFARTATGWKQVAELKPPGTPGSCFGSAVAVSGSTVVVNDACYSGDTGLVYVFTRGRPVGG